MAKGKVTLLLLNNDTVVTPNWLGKSAGLYPFRSAVSRAWPVQQLY